MALYVGDSTRSSWYKESGTYATITGTTPQWIGRVTEATPDESEGFFLQRYVGGGTRSVQNFVIGPTENKPSYKYMPQDWRILPYAYGVVSTAQVSGTNQHTITLLNSTGTFPSFALELAKVGAGTNQSTTYRGVVVDSLTIEGTQGQELLVTVNGVASSASGGTGVSSPTSGTKAHYLWSDCKGLNISGAALGLTGYVSEMKNFTITIANSLNTDTHYIRESRDISRPIPGNFDFTLQSTVNMAQATGAQITNTFRNGSTFNMDFYITRLGSAFTPTGTSGEWDFVQFWASGCIFEEAQDTYGPEGPTEQSFTIHGATAGAIVGDANAAAAYATFF